MNRKIIMAAILPLLILMLAFSGCDSLSPPTSSSSLTPGSSSQATGIWVTGTGEVTVTPDIAVLQVGVEAQDTTVAAAQAAATGAMDAVMAALAERGVAGEDIQTQYYRIRERSRWDNETGEEIITGYLVTNKVTAKIRMMPQESSTLDYKTGRIVDAVVSAGGDFTRIDDLSFSVEEPSSYYDEAREMAIEDAEARAKKLADLANVKLGAPTYIAESAGVSPIYGEIVYAATEGAIPAPAPVLPSISSGEVEVSLTVQVAYGIR
jgi:uncharacterized protein YggE